MDFLHELCYGEISKWLKERSQLHKIVEKQLWIFGEEYNLVTADKHFEKALSEYRYILDGYKNKEEYELDSIDKKKRMLLFFPCKKKITKKIILMKTHKVTVY